VRRVLQAAGIPVVESRTGEGDDAIATLAGQVQGGDVLIASNDKDLAALVGPGVTLLLQPGWQRVGPAEVLARHGVRSAQAPELLALQGDASDEIPGCPGVGPKTALALLQEFGSVAGVYQNLWKVKLLQGLRGAAQVAQRLAAGEASVRLSHQLAQLDRAVPGLPDLAALRWAPDRRRARQIQAVCEDLGIPTHTQGLVALQDGWGAAPHKERQ
jgi:DNA polymerase-1